MKNKNWIMLISLNLTPKKILSHWIYICICIFISFLLPLGFSLFSWQRFETRLDAPPNFFFVIISKDVSSCTLFFFYFSYSYILFDYSYTYCIFTCFLFLTSVLVRYLLNLFLKIFLPWKLVLYVSSYCTIRHLLSHTIMYWKRVCL